MNKFNFLDKVNGGVIIGIIDPELWCKLQNLKYAEPHIWDKKFPNWKENCVYYVIYPDYVPTYTEEEFYNTYPSISNVIRDECRTQYYLDTLIRAKCLALPEAALRLDNERN